MRWHWSYTSQPYRIAGIHYVPFLWGLSIAFFIMLFKPSFIIIAGLLSFYGFSLYYSKKHSIPMGQIPRRILSNMVGRSRKPLSPQDKRRYE